MTLPLWMIVLAILSVVGAMTIVEKVVNQAKEIKRIGFESWYMRWFDA
ncbi:hypothetical protein HCA63_06440 [Listeria booriae]|nr:hypothetical protein [Listeria booriae]MBC1887988.1 hypothetical protein [Listeria booriae]